MNRKRSLDQDLRELLADVPPHDATARLETLARVPETAQRRFRWLPLDLATRPRRKLPGYATFVAASVALVVIAVVVVRPWSSSDLPAGPTHGVEPPAAFDGIILCGPTIASPKTTSGDAQVPEAGTVVVNERRAAYRLSIESMSDTRLQGELVNQIDVDRYQSDQDELEVAALTWVLQNDAGSWSTQFVSFGTDPDDWATAVLRWTGAGAYEGLIALMSVDYLSDTGGGSCGWDVTGYVVEAELLPAIPEPIAALSPDVVRSPVPNASHEDQ